MNCHLIYLLNIHFPQKNHDCVTMVYDDFLVVNDMNIQDVPVTLNTVKMFTNCVLYYVDSLSHID